MSGPLPVSVIIPHCNRSELVQAAVASVLAQTVAPAEIIIVDDGSRPEHRDALSKLSKQTRIIYLDKHMGPSVARNAGIEAATQEWIAFLDDDDEWLPGKLERQWEFLGRDESLSAIASAMRVVSDTRPEWLLISHSPQIMTVAAALEGTVAMLQTTLIRAAAIRALQGFDPACVPYEDKEFWIRFTAAGYRAYYDREPLAVLNRRGMKRLTSYWRNCMRAQFKLINKHQSLYVSVCGPGAVHRERSKCIRRVGLEKGRIAGRMIYACGCVFGGAVPALVKLATTGKMQDVPYISAPLPE